jgi:hypothetical protein
VLLTRPPLATRPKPVLPFDLHVLSMPPAFNLSHDQTLQFNLDPRLLEAQLLLEFHLTCVKLPRYSLFSPELTCAPTPLLDLLVKELGTLAFQCREERAL